MSSIHHQGFFTTLLENFKNAYKYAIYKTIVLFFYNLISISVCVLLFYVTVQPLGSFSITLLIFVILVSVSIRLTISARVLPRVVCENKSAYACLLEAFKSFSFSQFMSRFMGYLNVCVLITTITIASSIFTFNVSLLITYPISIISFASIKFVDYYSLNHKKYYVSFDEIVVPKELRTNDENLLNKVDI